MALVFLQMALDAYDYLISYIVHSAYSKTLVNSVCRLKILHGYPLAPNFP